MKNLSLVALIASAVALTTAAGARMAPSAEVVVAPHEVVDVYGSPRLTQEDRQDVMAYVGKPLHEGYAMGCGGCNTCCTPMECPCVPVCCPDTHGLFDGGLRGRGCNNIQIWG